MDIHIYSVQAKSQAGNMSQTYNGNIKKAKTLKILKISAFCWIELNWILFHVDKKIHVISLDHITKYVSN